MPRGAAPSGSRRCAERRRRRKCRRAHGAMLPMLLEIAAALGRCRSARCRAPRIICLQPHDRTYATPVGGHEVVSFADGSQIELNTDTVLRARMTTDQRIVWLDKGEAYFQVKHDAAHPFVVMVGDHRVTDLGTKFLVRRDAGQSGSGGAGGARAVRCARCAHANRRSALLTPGDVATADGRHDVVVTQQCRRRHLTNELSWRHGVLVFDNTTLADAAAEFNRYNRQQTRHRRSGSRRASPSTARFRPTMSNAFTARRSTFCGLHVENRGNRDRDLALSERRKRQCGKPHGGGIMTKIEIFSNPRSSAGPAPCFWRRARIARRIQYSGRRSASALERLCHADAAWR